jgi:hypothetical protein
MCGRGPRFEPPQVEINGPNHDQFLVCPYALPAENTLTEISDNKGVCLFQARIVGHGIKPYRTHSQLSRNLPQRTPVPLVAYNTGLGMVGHHQAYNIGAVFFDGVRVCLDGHI